MKPLTWAIVAGVFAAVALGGSALSIIAWNSPPFAAGVHPRTKQPRGIVIHWTDTSSAASTLRVLQQRRLATTYEVDQAGRVYQYVDPARYYTDTSGGGANAETIGIDLTHRPGEPWAAAQVAATRQLVHALAQRFGFGLALAPDNVRQDWSAWRAGGYSLLRHRNLRPTECPGDFPMEALT